MRRLDLEDVEVEILFEADEIAGRIGELAGEIAARQPHRLLVVPVLKGSFVFAADLVRALHQAGLTPEIDFMTLSSYRKATKSSGTVTITRDVEADVEDRDVLLVDDILESGRTLAFAKDLLVARGARSVEACVLLDKPGKRGAHIEADLAGFTCPDVFVIGYGMDMANRFRELPFVARITDAGDD